MSVPFMLDPPPVVHQTAQTCWAASYESWNRANGNENSRSSSQMIRMLESMNGSGQDPMTTAAGRATPEGIDFIASIGLIQFLTPSPSSVTTAVLGELLHAGYLYLVYYRAPGAPAHAVVCYGVDQQYIHVMDPMPDRGLYQQPANFFLTMSQGRVMIGLSMLNLLGMNIDRSLSGLRQQAGSLSAADVMSQVRGS
jgi:hypothetical protein